VQHAIGRGLVCRPRTLGQALRYPSPRRESQESHRNASAQERSLSEMGHHSLPARSNDEAAERSMSMDLEGGPLLPQPRLFMAASTVGAAMGGVCLDRREVAVCAPLCLIETCGVEIHHFSVKTLLSPPSLNLPESCAALTQSCKSSPSRRSAKPRSRKAPSLWGKAKSASAPSFKSTGSASTQAPPRATRPRPRIYSVFPKPSSAS